MRKRLFSCMLFMIRYLPDGAAVPLVVRHINGTIGSLCQSAGTMLRRTRLHFIRSSREIVGKYFPVSRRLPVFEWHKNYIISFLRLGRPVPTAMEGDESAVLIFLRELVAGIKQHAIGSEVTGEGHYRVLVLFGGSFLAVAAIFGR